MTEVHNKLCTYCKVISIESLTSPHGHQLHDSIAELKDCAKTCPLCESALDKIENPTSIHDDTPWTKPGDVQKEFYARLVYGWKYYRAKGVTIVISPVHDQSAWDPENESDNGTYLRWRSLRTVEEDPASDFGVRTIRHLPRSTGTSRSVDHALRWVRQCLTSQSLKHDCWHRRDAAVDQALRDTGNWWSEVTELRPKEFARDEALSGQLKCDIRFLHNYQSSSAIRYALLPGDRPGRILHIVSSAVGAWPCESDVKHNENLILMDMPLTRVAYAALSYRWGTVEASWQTTRENLTSRQAGFHSNSLPLTLQQAITTAHNLGLCYIWIDCLCIVQNDPDEWRVEASKMAAVYQNAVVTLAADNAQDSHGGLWNEETVSYMDFCDAYHIKNTLRNEQASELMLYDAVLTPDQRATNIRDLGDLVSHSFLRDRGWTFQERVLSPRILHYASNQLFWECWHGLNESEDKYVELGKRDTIGKFALIHKSSNEASRDLSPSTRGDKRSEATKSLLEYWYLDAVNAEYSHRKLTFASDKLVAISGIAKALRAICPEIGLYTCGHWGTNIVRSLCWHRSGSGSKATGENYRAPSWSWASQDSAIDFGGYHFAENITAEFLDVSHKPDEDGQFEELGRPGWIHLKTKWQAGAVEVNGGHDFANHFSLTGEAVNLPPPKEKCSYLFMAGSEYSDIVWLDDDKIELNRDGQVRRAPDGSLRLGVGVMLLSEHRRGDKVSPGACLICKVNSNRYWERIGYTECLHQSSDESRSEKNLLNQEVVDVVIL